MTSLVVTCRNEKGVDISVSRGVDTAIDGLQSGGRRRVADVGQATGDIPGSE